MTNPIKTKANLTPARLEAFSDGVIAIIITIMVLEIHAPEGRELSDWSESIPVLLAYALSFVFIAIYWNNHHHLLRVTKKISASVMWANMHLLFWLSLIPVATAWVGGHHNYRYTWPVAIYSIICLMAGMAYSLLEKRISHANPNVGAIKIIGNNYKGLLSEALYITAIVFAFFNTLVSLTVIVAVALIWFIPDRQLENLTDEVSQ